MTLAALLPDPGGPDVEALQQFRRKAIQLMTEWARENLRKASPMSFPRLVRIEKNAALLEDPLELRQVLLEFIADYADWNNSTDRDFIRLSRDLVAAGNSALHDEEKQRPLVVDPFAGGGTIPIEALRIGADAFASDLNPVAILINKVLLEYVPRFAEKLGEAVDKWGQILRERALDRIGTLYPSDPDGSTPVAYLWTRILHCHGPGCGGEIPLITQLTIAKKRKPPVAAFLERLPGKTTRFDVRAVGPDEQVGEGTVRGGSVTCPHCNFTMSSEMYRRIAREEGLTERMYGVVLRDTEGKRVYRSITPADEKAFQLADEVTSQLMDASAGPISAFPEEPISRDEPRRLNVRHYGFVSWGDLFNSRQKVALATFASLVGELREEIGRETGDDEFTDAVVTVLSLCVSNVTHYLTNMSTYLSDGMISAFIQGSAIPMRADYAEANPLMDKLVGGLEYQLRMTRTVLEHLVQSNLHGGTATQTDATRLPLPDDFAEAIVTDPPYYFAIPYADLSDLFYVWLRRFLYAVHPTLLAEASTPKAEEAVQSLPHSASPSTKDRAHFENRMQLALEEARRVLRPDGLAVVIFANATTEGWESLIKALINARWVVTASWPIDTERSERMLASRQRVLQSSVHLVCRPRRDDAGIGEWRDVRSELNKKVAEWLPRLSAEGIEGADAIFACLGPAMEVYSRYDRVETASASVVPLSPPEDEPDAPAFLPAVWEVIANEALALVEAHGFEEDARITAFWLWTMRSVLAGTEEADESQTEGSNNKKTAVLSLDYDTARKLAQALGAELSDLARSGGVLESKGSMARLLRVEERRRTLIRDVDISSGSDATLFDPGPADKESRIEVGATTLDRLHQAMLLFSAGRSDTLRRFLTQVGDQRLRRLANALSALYPLALAEKRWVDGVIAVMRQVGD